MILNAIIAAKVKEREDVAISQEYRESIYPRVSETRRAINAETIRETVASAPPMETISAGICNVRDGSYYVLC